MIYEKVAKQINTIFPKINIKHSAKRAVIRSLVQQIECPAITKNDISSLIDRQTARKSLEKIKKTVQIWSRIIQNNEKARRAQVERPINRRQIQQLQYRLLDYKQIDSQDEFSVFVNEEYNQLLELSPQKRSLLLYPQICLPKEEQFYNTISTIQQQEYFKLWQQVNQKLGIYQELVQNQIQNMDHLEELTVMIQNDELIKKKDNNFHKIVKYTLTRTRQFMQTLLSNNQITSFFYDQLNFEIVQNYYLIFNSESDIWQNRDNQAYLQQVEKFLTEKESVILPKLYKKYIDHPLILLQNIRESKMRSKFEMQQLSPKLGEKVNERVLKLKDRLLEYSSSQKQISQQNFLSVYEQISVLHIEVADLLKYDNFKEKQKYLENRLFLVHCENELLKIFLRKGPGQNKLSTRRILAKEKVEEKQREFQKRNNINQSSLRNSSKTNKSIQVQVRKDLGIDVFVQNVFQSKIISQDQRTRIQSYKAKEDQLKKNCQSYLATISPQFGFSLEDANNFRQSQLFILHQATENSQLKAERQVINLLSKQVLKPEITERNLQKIYLPKFRFPVLKILSEKLVELSYKNTKILNGPDFHSLPNNIQQFIQNRHQFLKYINAELNKVLPIAEIISKLKLHENYDVAKYETYETLLKIIIAQKEVITYQLSFQQSGKKPPEVSNFVETKIYTPFLVSLREIMPKPYNGKNQLLKLVEEVEYYSEFIFSSDNQIQNFTKKVEEMVGSIDGKKKSESQKKNLLKLLGRYIAECQSKLNERKQIFLYRRVQQQINKLIDIARVCNNQQEYIKDTFAIKLKKMLQSIR